MLNKLQRLKWVDALLIMGMMSIIAGIGLSLNIKNPEKNKIEVISKTSPTMIQKAIQVDSNVVIDMSGEVINPGVYKLKKGDRVSDALAIAGGLAAKADREWVEKNINRAEILRDGEKIYIPRKNDQFLISNVQKIKGMEVININTAGVEELDKLNGVGPSMAQKIIDYRERNGGFKSKEEIKLVSGIGDKLYEGIKEKIDIN